MNNKSKKIVAIIQARMGATRLPGKVMMEVNGVPLIKYQVERIKRSKLIDEIVIATTHKVDDDPIVELCKKDDIDYFRGSEKDVLDRYHVCAKKHNADIIVRCTGDCPLVDPVIIDKTIHLLLDREASFAANTVPPDKRSFPEGSDVEVFTMEALERAHLECNNPHDREHVTFYFWMYDNGFSTVLINNEKDISNYRYTIDYPEDFEVLSFLINEIYREGIDGTVKEIVSLLNSNPEIKNKNSKYKFGIGWENK